jgi:beta-lactamase class A
MTRRDALAQTLSASAVLARPSEDLAARLAGLERDSGGRLGCAVLDTRTGKRIGRRAGERFPMCSTFKAPAVAFVLERVDRGEESLERRITYSETALLPHSPVTKEHVRGGMTIAALCAAAVTMSDNTAANLLLTSFGGPAALTGFLRSIGDAVTRLDRIEPELNEGAPGDPRDTTSPEAMLEDLRRFVLGDVLAPASRELFSNWLIANTTGSARLRAGFPAGWVIGDKTGSGGHRIANDIAVIWPPGRAPFLVTAYLTEGPGSAEARDAILAGVGRAVAREITQFD